MATTATLSPTSPSLARATPTTRAMSLGALLLGGKLEHKLLDQVVRKQGSLVSMRVPGFGRTVLVLDPQSVRDMVTCPPGSLISGRGNAVLGFLYGSTSIFLVDGPPHHRLRRLLVPPFRNRDTLASYARIMESVAQGLLDQLPVNQPFALLPELRHSMLEIILQVVFGLTEESRLAPFREAMTELLDISTSARSGLRDILRKRHGIKWPRLQQALQRSDDLIYAEIRRRRADPALAESDDILALLLRTTTEEGDLLTDKEVRDQLVTLLIAGHETTATTLAWAIELLLQNPKALERLRQSIRDNDDSYIDAVMGETLRLRPPIPVFSREVAEDFELRGCRIPKGTLLVAHIGYIHQRDDRFENPQDFEPQRFLGKRPEINYYAPFGGGLHSCIGNHFAALEVRVFLKVLFGRGHFSCNRKAEREKRQAILNLPRKGVRVTFMPRSVAPNAVG
jgi:cytochrome P450